MAGDDEGEAAMADGAGAQARITAEEFQEIARRGVPYVG
jgi:hypothetical protein